MEVDDVIAHAVYDPVARRKRYLETRKLKGRQQVGPKTGVRSRAGATELQGSSAHVPTAATAAARQAASNARQISAIRGRLNTLKAHLQSLLAQKKKESTSSSSSSKSSSKSTQSKPATAAQKAAAAKPKTAKQQQAAKESLKKAQDARAKKQKATPDKKTTNLTLDEQITRTRAVISHVETKLRTAIEQSRTQTASNSR